MAATGNLIDVIGDYYPANNDVGVPTGDSIWILFDVAMDQTTLQNQFFVEGPNTDQFVGPGFELLQYPPNVSQGDTFLTTPNYRGFVQGTFTFQNISLTDPTVITDDPVNYRTKMFFNPAHPLTPETTYIAHLPEALGVDMTMYTGAIDYTWTSGSGSITALPTTASTSILNSISPISPLNQLAPLEIVKFWPENESIKNDPNKFNKIVIEFNKLIDPTSINPDWIHLEAIPVTDHPDLSITAYGPLAKRVTVDGNKLIIQF
jgi:hypothetical protein